MKTEEIDRLIGMPDVDKEWEKFWSGLHSRQRRIVATIVAVFSLGLVAVASMLVISGKPESSRGSAECKVSEVSGKNIAKHDSLTAQPAEPLIFDNVEMQEIATAIGNHYRVTPEFRNEEARHVRLYLQIDCEKSLAETVEFLNNFHKLHFVIDGDKLIIE